MAEVKKLYIVAYGNDLFPGKMVESAVYDTPSAAMQRAEEEAALPGEHEVYVCQLIPIIKSAATKKVESTAVGDWMPSK